MENYNKEEFKKHLAEYVNLHIDSGSILVTSESGRQEVYQNFGTFLDYIRFEKEEVLKNKIKLKSVHTERDEEEGFQIHTIKVEIEGKAKTVSLQTRVFSHNQVRILCDKIKHILNYAA